MSARVAIAAWFIALPACTDAQVDAPSSGTESEQSESSSDGDGGDGQGGSASTEGTGPDCVDAGVCDADEICVATRGAVCMPLPDPGESCQQGCVETEHCCNCTAYSCTPSPDTCPEDASCACVTEAQQEGFLDSCPPDRSECEDTEDGPILTCVQVDFDEDPFADE